MYSSWEGRQREEQSSTRSLAPEEEGTPSQNPLVQAVSCPHGVSGCSGEAGWDHGGISPCLHCLHLDSGSDLSYNEGTHTSVSGQEVPAPPAPMSPRLCQTRHWAFQRNMEKVDVEVPGHPAQIPAQLVPRPRGPHKLPAVAPGASSLQKLVL